VGDFGSLAGVAQINQGGTGQTTRVAALNALLPDQAGSTQYMLLTDGSGTVSWGAQPVAGLPSQTGNSGRLLTTNGSTASWSNAVTVSGSNATVGGTLTVTGALTTSSIVNNGANGVALDTGGSASLRFTDSATSKWWIYKLSGDSLLYFRDMVNSRMQMSMTPGATSSAALTILSSSVLIDSTTASTTASSGALVVSGGLGVGGAINAGGAITAGTDGSLVAVYVPGDSALRAAGGKLYLDTRLTDGGDIVLRPRISAALTLTAATNAATFTGAVSVSSTTASTTTSSGALVVGNGTSGGLGVGGAIWGGGKVHVGSAGYADGGAKLNVYATPSDAGYLYGIRLSDNSTATLALGLQTPTGTTSSFIHSNIALGFGTVGTAALNINTSQQVQVLATTASNNTSSGALVVSGGVGVAGAIYAGGNIEASGGADFTSVASSFARIHTVSSAPRLTLVRSGSTSNRRAFDIINNADGLISMRFVNDDLSGSTLAATISYTGDFRITGTLQVGNTYASGAPTATGYIVIKDSTGTSYKIPAVAL
jgi:hypothetical protein